MLGRMDAPSDLGSPGAAPRPDPSAGPPGPRRLRRRPDDGHIAGVCAGVAEYFNVDPVLVRIAAVVLAFSGPGVFAYILAWIFVPADPGRARYGEPQAPIDRKDRATQIFGIVLLGLGVSVIWGDWWSPLRGWLFPLGLIALGGWLLFRPDRDDPPPPVPPIPPAPPASGSAAWSWPGSAPVVSQPAPPADVDGPTTAVEGAIDPITAAEDGAVDDVSPDATTLDATATDADVDTTMVQPTTAPSDSGSGGGDGGAPPTAPWDVPPPPVPDGPAIDPRAHDRNHRHRHRHLVGPGVFGVLLIWTGIAWLTGVSLTTGLAVGLVILGLGFVLGSFVGGSRWLILPALLVAIALAVSAFIDIPLSGPIGQQQWSPDSLDELQDTYEISMGEGTLDLRGLPPVEDDLTVRATVGFGHLIVLVPPDQDLLVDTEVGAGEVVVFGEQQNGVGYETHEAYHGDTDGTLTLDLQAGMGQIEVRYGISRDRGATEPTESPEPTTPSTLG
jgi:phage shock protein PspC (stress-responsive transcriptional regulator)